MKLTPRELDIVRLVAAAHQDKAIAASLGIGTQTVRNHLVAIRRKTNCGCRTALALWAIRGGCVALTRIEPV